METKKCPECESSSFIENYKEGDIVCTECGLIILAGLQEKDAYMPHSSVDIPTRRFRKCKTTERDIRDMCINADLKFASVAAQIIYENALGLPTYKCRKGDNALGFIVAIIFHACKLCGVPRTPKELCEIFGCKLSNMRRMVKETQRAADKVVVCKSYSFSSPDPVQIFHRYSQKLELSENDMALLKECASEMWPKFKKALFTLDTDSIVSGLLFHMYGGDHMYLERIARACNVCRNTVKGVYAKMIAHETACKENI